jgi:hypothetical protein
MDAGTGSDAGCMAPAADTTYADTVTVDATSTSSVAKGSYTRDGMMFTTSDAALKAETAHAKHYDGATQFKATYSIVVDDKGVLDKTRSTVKFKTVNYTSEGKSTLSSFETTAIKVTGVELTADCPPKLKSFTFESTDWYPVTGEGQAGLKDRTLTGSMDVTTGSAMYVAKYAIKSNGAIYSYSVTSLMVPPRPPVPPMPPPQPPLRDAVPSTAQEIYAPLDPDPELADPGTPCSDSNQCDEPDGITCQAGVCE